MGQDEKTLKKDRELAARGYPETMNARQTSALLGVCRRTLHTLVAEGELEAFRVRRDLRFERLDLAHYIRVSRVSTEKPESKPRAPATKRRS
jgi:excisionase family DNA binding protein